MSLQVASGIISTPTPVRLAAGATTVYTAPRTGATFHQILVANDSVSAATILLTKHDGATAFPILPGKSVPANDYILLEFDFMLPTGWTLKATPGTADVLTIHMTLSARS